MRFSAPLAPRGVWGWGVGGIAISDRSTPFPSDALLELFPRIAAACTPSPPAPEALKKLNGRDALLRVRDGKPNTDAEHRVPTGSGLYAQPNFFTAPLSRVGERGAEISRGRQPVRLPGFRDRN